MEYKYNSIYTKDNKDCMDIGFLFKGKERDYVYIDNIENIKFEDSIKNYYDFKNNKFDQITIKFNTEIDRENKKLICNMEYDYENNESTFIAEIDLQKYVDAIAHCIYNMQDYSENMHFNEIKNYFINQTCYELFSKNNLFITNLTLDKMVYFVYDNKDIIGVSNKFKISRKENSIYLRMDNYVYSYVLNNINNYNVQIYIYNNNNIIAIEDYDIEILDNDRNFINIIFRNSQLINYSDKYPKVEYIKFDNDYIKKLQGILVKPQKITDNNKYKINNIDNIFDDL